MTFRERHPELTHHALHLVVASVAIYCLLAAVLASGVRSDRVGCLVTNVSRDSNYDNARATAAENRELNGQEHDPEIAAIYARIAARQDERVDGILSTAASTGHQIASDKPIIDCNAAYPQLLPWFSS